MKPTSVSGDLEVTHAVDRRTLSRCTRFPYDLACRREAGYAGEMAEVERVPDRDDVGLAARLSDRWIDDTTLAGPPGRIREGVEELVEAGVRTPILVPSSAVGNQMKVFAEVFGIYTPA